MSEVETTILFVFSIAAYNVLPSRLIAISWISAISARVNHHWPAHDLPERIMFPGALRSSTNCCFFCRRSCSISLRINASRRLCLTCKTDSSICCCTKPDSPGQKKSDRSNNPAFRNEPILPAKAHSPTNAPPQIRPPMWQQALSIPVCRVPYNSVSATIPNRGNTRRWFYGVCPHLKQAVLLSQRPLIP